MIRLYCYAIQLTLLSVFRTAAEYPGMEARPWWASASSVSEQLNALVQDLVTNLSALQLEGEALLTSRGCGTEMLGASEESCFKHNQEGVHEGGEWIEANLVPLGGGNLDPLLCGNGEGGGFRVLLPKLSTPPALTSLCSGRSL